LQQFEQVFSSLKQRHLPVSAVRLWGGFGILAVGSTAEDRFVEFLTFLLWQMLLNFWLLKVLLAAVAERKP